MESAVDDGRKDFWHKADSKEEGDDVKFFKRLSGVMTSFGLTPFSSSVAVEYLKAQLAKEGGAEVCSRVLAFLLSRLNNKNQTLLGDSDGQRGCPNIVPGLRAMAFWGLGGGQQSCEGRANLREVFPWVGLLEDNVDVIREEFLALRGTSAFQPYRSPIVSTEGTSSETTTESDSLGQLATDRGAWNVAYLYLHGLDFAGNLALCPRTAALIAQVPRHYHHAFFSALAPGSHITPHYGPTNKKLRFHLPIVVPADDNLGSETSPAWLRVDSVTVRLETGRGVLFDDSFLHEAGNDSPSSPRVVLVLDLWHPDLTDVEVRFLQFINKGQMSAAARLAKQREEQEGDNSCNNGDFLSVIREARRAAQESSMTETLDGAVWPHKVVDD